MFLQNKNVVVMGVVTKKVLLGAVQSIKRSGPMLFIRIKVNA